MVFKFIVKWGENWLQFWLFCLQFYNTKIEYTKNLKINLQRGSEYSFYDYGMLCHALEG